MGTNWRGCSRYSEESMDLSADYRGASIVAALGGRFLWAISSRDHWKKRKGRLYVCYEGIGGGVNPRESFEDAARRECVEETGCEAELISAKTTYVLDDVRGVFAESGSQEPSPLMVWRKKLVGGKRLLACTYLAHVKGSPRPMAEVPALLCTPSWEVLRRATPTIQEILDNGAVLVETQRVSRKAVVRPWGTPVYLRRLMTKVGFGPLSPVMGPRSSAEQVETL